MEKEKWIKYGVAIFFILILLFGSVAIVFLYTSLDFGQLFL
ncbi:MAG: hypothetical protein ACI37V_01865 [Methanobrevibacter sp.]